MSKGAFVDYANHVMDDAIECMNAEMSGGWRVSRIP